MHIAVSGNLGSGKTTVAQGLAKAFACELYPRRSYNRSYIEDLFREPQRWTTEAQISFIVHKHDEVRQGMERGKLFILDRSFDEEIAVFAERFHDDGTIDSRSIELLRQLAADLRQRLEQPSLIVLCDCPVTACRDRLAARPRSYQASYPDDHLEKLDSRLRAWIGKQSIPILVINTLETDYRDEANARELARRIDQELTRARSNQLDLFAEHGEPDFEDAASRPSLLRKRRVYLAAPFTARATMKVRASSDEGYLFDGDGSTEDIPVAYRRKLTALARAIEDHGHEVLLPHRDINRWGKRSLSSSEVARRCLAAVEDSDCFIGLIAESFGSHAEFAYALGLGKPSLIMLSSRDPTSFFGQGMAALQGVATISAKSIGTLTTAVKQIDPLTKMTWGGRWVGR
ncbi:deoxynucleoside kinase [Sphingobium sp. BHU LFT2]|uniref:deoxynucleoside kinase n=1 Tax=Sphingobium sp. BHU LFT2 TaxID=2807634 RepID=UPI001BEA1A66|nr:deoxynucleoside kinase [Sphingobium sp. BHU LFT2]MBT2244301.1 deoxynucleoside kinase [Sphingobium sp. BHU LFT2]